MKKKIIATLLSAAALLMFISGCDLGMAESVRIKTDPTVEVNLGERVNIFSELLDIDQELADMTADTEGLDRDTTVTEGNPISLHLQQDMIDISINDFAGDTLELDSVDQTIDPVTFDVPEISSNETIAQGFDPIELPVDAEITPITLTTGLYEVNVSSQDVSTPGISANGFDSLTFASGTLSGAVSITDGSTNLEINILSAAIMDSTGTTEIIAATNASPSDPLTADGTLIFDLTGKELPSDFTMDLTIAISGGDSSSFGMGLAFSFSTDTTVSAATGITVHQSVNDTIAIPMASANVISATIGAGGVDLDLTFGTGWAGLTQTIDMELLQGGISIGSVTGVTIGSGVEWDFAGLTLGEGDLTLEYTVYVDSISDGSADFAVESGVNEITGTADSTITNFSSLTMSAPGMNFQQEQATNLGSDIIDLVQTINFDSAAGVTVSLTNNLPTDLDVTITSAALGVSGTNTYAGNSSTLVSNTWDIQDAVNIASITDSAIDADTDPDVDFIVDISLDGFDETNEELTLLNVTPGTTYSLDGSVAADLTIGSVVIANASMNDQFPAAGDDPLDFSMLGDFLPDSITFDDITASFDLAMDAGSSDLSLDMLVYAQYDDADGTGQYLNLVGTDNDSDNIPDTPLNVTGTGTSTVDLSGIGTLINNRAFNITIFYDVTASGATVDLSGSTDQRISAAVSADIPFSMHASSNASLEVDGAPLIDPATEDLFGRDGSADDEDINDYLDMLSTASIELTFITPDTLTPAGEGLLGIGFSMIEDSNPAGYSDFNITKELTINKAESTGLSISVTPEQIERMIADDAFMPVYDVYLIGQYEDTSDPDPANWVETGYSGDHQFVEGFDLDITATMSIQSDVDYTIEM